MSTRRLGEHAQELHEKDLVMDIDNSGDFSV